MIGQEIALYMFACFDLSLINWYARSESPVPIKKTNQLYLYKNFILFVFPDIDFDTDRGVVGPVKKSIRQVFFPPVKKHDEIRFTVDAIADLSLKRTGK